VAISSITFLFIHSFLSHSLQLPFFTFLYFTFTMFARTGLVAASLLSVSLAVSYDVRSQWAWIDKSCDGLDGRLNQAGEDYTNMVNAALGWVGEGADLPNNPLKELTVQAYLGNHDKDARLLEAKWNKLAKYNSGNLVPYSLYCDATAFEWVTEYKEGDKKGQPLSTFKEGGAWHTKEGRYDPSKGPLYLDGSGPSDLRKDYCHTPKGETAAGVSSIGGSHVVLCPDAFKYKAITDPELEAEVGTTLDAFASTGGTLLHEMTHVVLSTTDIMYRAIGCLISNQLSKGKSGQKNADSWMNFGMAALLSKRAWTMGHAQPLDNYGPGGPKLNKKPAGSQRRWEPTPVHSLWSRNETTTYNIEHSPPFPPTTPLPSYEEVVEAIEEIIDELDLEDAMEEQMEEYEDEMDKKRRYAVPFSG
jgi:hypothetical protein